MTKVAKRIRELREAKAITQKTLALHLGCSESAVGMWELGKNEPDISTISALCSFFGVSVGYLLDMPTVSSNNFSFSDENIKYGINKHYMDLYNCLEKIPWHLRKAFLIYAGDLAWQISDVADKACTEAAIAVISHTSEMIRFYADFKKEQPHDMEDFNKRCSDPYFALTDVTNRLNELNERILLLALQLSKWHRNNFTMPVIQNVPTSDGNQHA